MELNVLIFESNRCLINIKAQDTVILSFCTISYKIYSMQVCRVARFNFLSLTDSSTSSERKVFNRYLYIHVCIIYIHVYRFKSECSKAVRSSGCLEVLHYFKGRFGFKALCVLINTIILYSSAFVND